MKTKADWLEALLVTGPFLALVIFWRELPGKVPMHWNLSGEVDRWSPAMPGMLLLPIVSLVTVALCRLLPQFEPKLRRTAGPAGRMPNALQVLRISLAAFFALIFALQLAAALGHDVSGTRIVTCAVLLLLAICGNYFSNLRPNYFFGIRTPWTLEDEDTWRATHRLGGRLLFFGSLALLVICLVANEKLSVSFVIAATVSFAVWGVLYSWHYSRSHGLSR